MYFNTNVRNGKAELAYENNYISYVGYDFNKDFIERSYSSYSIAVNEPTLATGTSGNITYAFVGNGTNPGVALRAAFRYDSRNNKSDGRTADKR